MTSQQYEMKQLDETRSVALMNKIQKKIKKIICPQGLLDLTTKDGRTQYTERAYQEKFKILFEKMVSKGTILKYVQAGSQKPYDFRLFTKNGILYLEIKKATTNVVKLNDTYPTKDVYYMILYTGNKNNRGCIFWKRGDKLIEIPPQEEELLETYKKDIKGLKDMRKGFKEGNLSVYPRPGFDVNIRKFIQECNSIM
jgi:hypothetical protein